MRSNQTPHQGLHVENIRQWHVGKLYFKNDLIVRLSIYKTRMK